MKKCFRCNELKPLSEFYKQKGMTDGHLNKCKSCTKADVSKNRADKVHKYRDYDRNRRPLSDARKEKNHKRRVEDIKKFPQKYKAQHMVSNAIFSKKLVKKPCEICGNPRVQGHHDDYLEPLNIRWLCSVHHSQWHNRNGPGKNKTGNPL